FAPLVLLGGAESRGPTSQRGDGSLPFPWFVGRQVSPGRVEDHVTVARGAGNCSWSFDALLAQQQAQVVPAPYERDATHGSTAAVDRLPRLGLFLEEVLDGKDGDVVLVVAGDGQVLAVGRCRQHRLVAAAFPQRNPPHYGFEVVQPTDVEAV